MNVLLDKAIAFASKKHEGMKRKGTGQPYIYHPLEVLNLASLITNDEDILCAAMLHDTVEDTNTTKEELKEEFNERIAEIVSYETEDKRGQVNKEATWKIRKEEALIALKNAPDEGSKIVCLCDKVANLRSFHMMLLQEGEQMWNHFNNKDPLMHYWYYNSIREILIDLKDTAVYKEYSFLVDTIFNKYIKGE